MKYLDPKFLHAVGSAEYRDGWERVFASKEEREAENPSPPSERRPRGNWTLCDDKYWVSWGPTKRAPDPTTGAHIFVRTNAEDLDGWVELRHPTSEQFQEIINAMAQRLSLHGDDGSK